MICSKCKKTIKDGSKFCGYCGKKFSFTAKETNPIKETVSPTKTETPTVSLTQTETQAAPVAVSENVAKCPKCGSTSLQAQKEGVKVGRAVAGALLLGPLGLAAGAVGANNLKIVCLNCGHIYTPTAK